MQARDSVEQQGSFIPEPEEVRGLHTIATADTKQRLTQQQYPKSPLLSLLYSSVSASQGLKPNKSPRIERCVARGDKAF